MPPLNASQNDELFIEGFDKLMKVKAGIGQACNQKRKKCESDQREQTDPHDCLKPVFLSKRIL